MGKYDALVAAARSLLLKLKDINITGMIGIGKIALKVLQLSNI